jgi:hypothetical protein
MDHVRGAPHHPMTPGKIERWHQTLKTASSVCREAHWLWIGRRPLDQIASSIEMGALLPRWSA